MDPQLTPVPVFRKKTHGEAPNPQHRVQAAGCARYLADETLHGLSQRHDLSRNLIRIWVEKYQAGGLDEDVAAADLLQSYEARIAALERLVGKQALELEFLKGAPRAAPRPRSATTSAITGPAACSLPKDAG